MKCIDISTWNGNIDFDKVKASGIEAVIIRAGFGRETSQKDNQFENNYAKAKAAGLHIGVYWYSYADGVYDAKVEAQACLSCLNGKQLDMPVYFDMEESFQTSFGKTVLTNMAIAFCDTIKAGGYNAGVYSNANWLSNYLDYGTLRSKYSIWLAQWSNSHSISCDIWQYSEDGSISGIAGSVDMNVIENTSIINGEGGNDEVIEYGRVNNSIWAYKQHLRILHDLGVIKTEVADDGGFGPGTLNATKEVQKAAGIEVDGIVGRQTINALYNLEKEAYKKLLDKIDNAKNALA